MPRKRKRSPEDWAELRARLVAREKELRAHAERIKAELAAKRKTA